ncbi:MAG: hypothetical protein WAO61_00435 [Solirubrobacterales bacterium]
MQPTEITGKLITRRRIAWASIALVYLVTVVQVVRWFVQEADNLRPGWPGLLAFGLVTVPAAGAAIFIWAISKLIGNSVRRRPPPRVTWLTFAACLAFGFSVSMPFTGGWDDGCNGHGASFPAIAIPYLAYFAPDDPLFVYSDGSTLVACTGNPRGHGFGLT